MIWDTDGFVIRCWQIVGGIALLCANVVEKRMDPDLDYIQDDCDAAP